MNRTLRIFLVASITYIAISGISAFVKAQDKLVEDAKLTSPFDAEQAVDAPIVEWKTKVNWAFDPDRQVGYREDGMVVWRTTVSSMPAQEDIKEDVK